MQGLVNEVHQLRVAVERLGSIMPRIQIAMQRWQMQEQRVTDASRQLKDLRARLTAVTAEQNREASRVQDLEDRIRNQETPTGRSILKEQQDQVRLSLQRAAEMVQQLSAQEAELSGSLRTEQAKLDEVTEKLTALERAFESK